MPIITRENEYPGVNPHLNSHLQQPNGGWSAFHAELIIQLRRALDAVLPSNYYASVEIANGTWDDEFKMVVIYRLDNNTMPGKPITRLEVLSPANMPGGSHHALYLGKRQQTLDGGLCLVEIDLLHESPPLLLRIARYTADDASTYPYYILITNPHPLVNQTAVYGVGLLDSLPTLAVPLGSPDAHIDLDFNSVYQATFNETRIFPLLVDYEQEPVNMQRYSATDQAAIRQQMATIATTHRHG